MQDVNPEGLALRARFYLRLGQAFERPRDELALEDLRSSLPRDLNELGAVLHYGLGEAVHSLRVAAEAIPDPEALTALYERLFTAEPALVPLRTSGYLDGESAGGIVRWDDYLRGFGLESGRDGLPADHLLTQLRFLARRLREAGEEEAWEVGTGQRLVDQVGALLEGYVLRWLPGLRRRLASVTGREPWAAAYAALAEALQAGAVHDTTRFGRQWRGAWSAARAKTIEPIGSAPETPQRCQTCGRLFVPAAVAVDPHQKAPSPGRRQWDLCPACRSPGLA